jgi:hypothetical protein
MVAATRAGIVARICSPADSMRRRWCLSASAAKGCGAGKELSYYLLSLAGIAINFGLGGFATLVTRQRGGT